MSNIFEGFLTTPESMDAFGDRNFVAAMLRFEAALTRAQAACGLIPEAAAQSIVDTCKVDLFDASKIVRESARAGSLAIPMVKSLKETVGLFNQEAVQYVHLGSTSQDVIDTAMALITRDMLTLIEADLHGALQAIVLLGEAHCYTPVLSRTLMQPASVTSFGLKCFNWAAPLVRSLNRLQTAKRNALKVQLGGSAGTQARLGPKSPEIVAHMAQALGLGVATAPWHTQRDEWIALGCELGLMVGSLGKLAKDISVLSQFEVGEVSEARAPGRGSPAEMPHKNNPVASMISLVAAQRAPQRIATLLAAMTQEHERALGGWQTELAEWSQLLMSAHASARAMGEALPELAVHPQRMRKHLDDAARSVDRETAATWFDPQLADGAGRMAERYFAALREELQPPFTLRRAGPAPRLVA